MDGFDLLALNQVGGILRASLRFEKRLNIAKLSIFFRVFSCFVVINPRVLSGHSVDFWAFVVS